MTSPVFKATTTIPMMQKHAWGEVATANAVPLGTNSEDWPALTAGAEKSDPEKGQSGMCDTNNGLSVYIDSKLSDFSGMTAAEAIAAAEEDTSVGSCAEEYYVSAEEASSGEQTPPVPLQTSTYMQGKPEEGSGTVHPDSSLASRIRNHIQPRQGNIRPWHAKPSMIDQKSRYVTGPAVSKVSSEARAAAIAAAERSAARLNAEAKVKGAMQTSHPRLRGEAPLFMPLATRIRIAAAGHARQVRLPPPPPGLRMPLHSDAPAFIPRCARNVTLMVATR